MLLHYFICKLDLSKHHGCDWLSLDWMVRVSIFWCHRFYHVVERSTGGGQDGTLLGVAIELQMYFVFALYTLNEIKITRVLHACKHVFWNLFIVNLLSSLTHLLSLDIIKNRVCWRLKGIVLNIPSIFRWGAKAFCFTIPTLFSPFLQCDLSLSGTLIPFPTD